MQYVIVKRNGEPYASEAVARQQILVKGLSATHEARMYGKGWAIMRVGSAREESINLQPGDYVSTEGMTEDQYHAVAKAFIAAGASEREYPQWTFAKDAYLNAFGWDGSGLFHHDVEGVCGFKRKLTIAQVLSATNARGPRDEPIEHSPATPIDTLHAAERQLLDAQEALRSAEAVFGEAMDAVRAELGGSFTLTHEAQEVRDLPPEEWQEGDVVECVKNRLYFTEGKTYVVDAKEIGGESNGRVDIKADDDGDKSCPSRSDFKFHHRPTK